MKEARLGTYSLVCHPQTPPLAVRKIDLKWNLLPDGRLMLRWYVEGAALVLVPAFAGKGRANGLWEHTCFEMFLKGAGTAYREYNFSPSERWAAYGFTRYREGTSEVDMPTAPTITCAKGETILTCTAMMPATVLDGADHAGICAVIEEQGGHKSYWALAHAPGVPDFHRADCFALAIAGAEEP